MVEPQEQIISNLDITEQENIWRQIQLTTILLGSIAIKEVKDTKPLSDNQRTVLHLYSFGMKFTEIAKEIDVELTAVERLLSSAERNLQMKNKTGAIRQAYRTGELPLDNQKRTSISAELNTKETTLIDLIAQGLTNNQIADLYKVPVSTIMGRVQRIRRKTEGKSREHLVGMVLESGTISPFSKEEEYLMTATTLLIKQIAELNNYRLNEEELTQYWGELINNSKEPIYLSLPKKLAVLFEERLRVAITVNELVELLFPEGGVNINKKGQKIHKTYYDERVQRELAKKNLTLHKEMFKSTRGGRIAYFMCCEGDESPDWPEGLQALQTEKAQKNPVVAQELDNDTLVAKQSSKSVAPSKPKKRVDEKLSSLAPSESDELSVDSDFLKQVREVQSLNIGEKALARNRRITANFLVQQTEIELSPAVRVILTALSAGLSSSKIADKIKQTEETVNRVLEDVLSKYKEKMEPASD